MIARRIRAKGQEKRFVCAVSYSDFQIGKVAIFQQDFSQKKSGLHQQAAQRKQFRF
jgi:hypothetical protein